MRNPHGYAVVCALRYRTSGNRAYPRAYPRVTAPVAAVGRPRWPRSPLAVSGRSRVSSLPAITETEIRQLTELHDRYRKEAAVCADAGAFTAATVMMGSALEAMLVCTVRMAEHVLRPANLWPTGDPTKWTLGTVVKAANDAHWFD